MTEKQTYWMADDTNAHALVTGADERDRFRGLGWREADEEPGDGFVHVWRDGIAEPGRAPLALFREVLTHQGWVPGPPPGGDHPFAEAAAVTAEASDAGATPDNPPQKKTTSRAAAGATEKGV